MDNDIPSASPAPSPPPLRPPIPSKPRPRSATGWKIAVIVLVVLLGFSMLLNLGSFVEAVLGGSGGGSYSSSAQMQEVVMEDNESQNKILVVPVEGMIFGDSINAGNFGLVQSIKNQLDRAAEDSRVKAVVLAVNSPGGEVLASDDISRAIAKFQKESGKPVVASMGSLAASGGYYVSAPCRWIVASELTITGSIGVIMQGYNYRGLMDKVGVYPLVFKSGKYKDMLSGSKEPHQITDEERDLVQAMVDETFGKFKQVVAEGRSKANEKNKDLSDNTGRELVSNWAEYADGRILSGLEAFKYGFVDELGGLDTAAQRAKKLSNTLDANLVRYQQRLDFSSLFQLLGQSKAKTIKLDLGMERPALKAGHLYFISPLLVH